MWKNIKIDEMLALAHKIIIDVRSPNEYEKESIPGAINIPLLNDQQRAAVGTTYVQDGEFKARRLALELVSPNAVEFADKIIAHKEHNKKLIVHCWRGGLRSEATASFLSLMGVDSFRLEGGYKAYRNKVLEALSDFNYPFSFVVLQGQTGCGKTIILEELEKSGQYVINLEVLARHRGSLFGSQDKQPGQKDFEASIFEKLEEIGKLSKQRKQKPIVFLEAEAKKIGKLVLPDALVQIIKKSPKILLTAGLKCRVERIYNQYIDNQPEAKLEYYQTMLLKLKERLGSKVINELLELYKEGKLKTMVAILTEQYYDILYAKELARDKDLVEYTFSSENIHDCVHEIIHKASELRTTTSCEYTV